MRNKAVCEILTKIKIMIENEQYEDAKSYIESQKIQILFDNDRTEDYIDSVVEALK